MKKLLSLLVIIAVLLPMASISFAKTSVKGYYKKNGTYVKPHYRSDKDSSFYNNWSTKGNYNPYTGQKGYKTYKFKYSR